MRWGRRRRTVAVRRLRWMVEDFQIFLCSHGVSAFWGHGCVWGIGGNGWVGCGGGGKGRLVLSVSSWSVWSVGTPLPLSS